MVGEARRGEGAARWGVALLLFRDLRGPGTLSQGELGTQGQKDHYYHIFLSLRSLCSNFSKVEHSPLLLLGARLELPSKRLWTGVVLKRLGLASRAPCSSPALPCTFERLASSILVDLMVGVALPALGPLLLRPRPPDLFTMSSRRVERLEST